VCRIRENSALQRYDLAVGMGLRFINLSPEVATAVGGFLTDHDSLYHDDE
jgi:hypothetical protein